MQQWPVSYLNQLDTLSSRPGTGFAGDPTLRSVLFLPSGSQDTAADAVRDTALELGSHAARPVLLLDLTVPGNRHVRAFAEADMLVPRRAAPPPGPAGFAFAHFEQIRGTNLFVSRVSPDPAAFAETTWIYTGRSAFERLHRLFGAIVVAGPDPGISDGGLHLAAEVDGVVLVLGSGMTRVSEAREMRNRVLQAGGHLMGSVLTNCARYLARDER